MTYPIESSNEVLAFEVEHGEQKTLTVSGYNNDNHGVKFSLFKQIAEKSLLFSQNVNSHNNNITLDEGIYSLRVTQFPVHSMHEKQQMIEQFTFCAI